MYADIRIQPQGIFIPELSLTSTNSALIFRDISAESPNADFKQTALDELQFNIQSNNSAIGGRDISCFLPQGQGFDNKLIIDGTMSGKLNQLKADYLHVMLDSIVDIYSTFEVQNIANSEEMSFNVELNDLLIDIVEASSFAHQMLPNLALDVSPYTHWEDISYHGNISGILNNFAANGEIITKYGTLNTDVFVNLYDNMQTIEYNGDISTENFHVGEAFQNTEVLGDASASLFVSGGKQADGKFAN